MGTIKKVETNSSNLKNISKTSRSISNGIDEGIIKSIENIDDHIELENFLTVEKEKNSLDESNDIAFTLQNGTNINRETFEMLEANNIDYYTILNIKYDNNNNIIVQTTTNDFIIDGRTKRLTDVLDLNGNSVVQKIDIYSDEAIEYGLYGGYQGDLSNNFYSWYRDVGIRDIINKYYPDEELVDFDYRDLFAKMNSNGCGYIASINCVFEGTSYLTDQEFYDKFGFDRYNIVYNADGTYVKTYNYNYMFLDYYLFHQQVYGGFNSIKEIYGNIGDTSIDGALSEEEYTGARGLNENANGPSIQLYLNKKGIYCEYDNIIGGMETDLKKRADYISLINDFVYTNKVIEALNNGEHVMISMEDFTMYSTEDLDNNGLLDDVLREDVGKHQMEVIEVTENGDYIVSSWGDQYIVRPNIASLWNELYGLTNNGITERTWNIVICDF